jgi:putative methyltransferase (TIGR04325 family)
MSYGYVLGRAAQFLEEISILDWGSGIGHYYALTRALWPEIRLRYTAYDFAEFCETGRELLPGVDFVEDPETALAGSYHLVMAGSSLWYSQDWQQCLASLAAASTKYVYVTRMIFVRESPSFVAVQRPWRYGYNTEYQCWVLNRLSFLDAAEACDLCLEREFIFGEAPAIYGAPEHGTFRGFLFRKTRS